ncbi:MAG: hypothetical protein ACLRFE_01160 [Clostridia bacterium]
MSYDNHPPRHNSIGELRHPERLSIYNVGSNRRGLISRLLYPYFVALTMQELRTIILMKEKPIQGLLSRKQYKMHLAQKERIKQFLEKEKLEKENKEKSL